MRSITASGLPVARRLLAVDFALLGQHFGRDFFAPQIARIDRGDVHGDVVAELLEGIGAGHEVGLAIDFHDHADLSAGVNVVADQAFAGLALRLLGRGGLAFFAQDVDGLFDVAVGFHQRRAAIGEARAGAFAQFFHEMGWDLHGLRLCTHPFLAFHELQFLF